TAGRTRRINLLAELSVAVHHVRLLRLVALRQVRLQQLQPYSLASVAQRPRMAKRSTGARKPLLNVVVQPCEQLHKGPFRHTTTDAQFVACAATKARFL